MADVASCQSSNVHIFRGTLTYDCKVVTKFGGDVNRIRVDTSPNFLSRGVTFSSTTFTSFVQHSHSTLVEAGAVIPSRQHHFPTHSFSLNIHSSSHFSSEDLLVTAQTFKLQRRHNALTERDPNFSGRMGRVSNMSTDSRGLQKGNAAKPDFFSNAPGVMSMPRTPTEPGDIRTLTFDPSHLPSMPRAPQVHRRSGAVSRLSTGSAHSKRASNYHAQPFGSSSTRCSLTRGTNVSQYLPDTLSPTMMSLQGSSPLIPHARLSRDDAPSQ